VAVEHGGLLQVAQLPPARRVIRRLDRASGIWACQVEVAVSDFMFQELRKRRHADQLICIRNGIDLARFSPDGSNSLEEHPFTIGYAGRLIASKGVSDVIQAFATMTMPHDSRLVIAGDGPERQALEQLARTCGVAERTHFLGYVDDMPGFWRSCDIGVVPSAGWIESFCLSAVEAMACGRPVVASRTGALPETIKDGVTGTLVDRGDKTALARAFERYKRGSALRKEHGANARRFCEERYDLAASVEAYLDLIASLSRKDSNKGF
jgi:glycosyltransferase involved in cell wall biosynthesis